MKAITLISILSLGLLMGCSSEPAAPEAGATTGTTAASTTTAQEMAKCGGCGKEVAKATLVSHDGKMMCTECMASHNH